MMRGGDEDDAVPGLFLGDQPYAAKLGLGDLDGLAHEDEGGGRHAVALEHEPRFVLEIVLAYPHADELIHARGRQLVGDHHARRQPLPVERGRRGLASGNASGKDDDGVGRLEGVLHHEGGTEPAEGRSVAQGDGESEDDQDGGPLESAPRARRHRSSSTRYSFMRRASGASGLSPRYARKAALAFSGSLLW